MVSSSSIYSSGVSNINGIPNLLAKFIILTRPSVFIFPFLIAISMFLGILGGYVMGVGTGACTPYQFVYGIQAFFEPWKLYYSFTKVVVFAFIITSVSSYCGYYVSGGALEVGKGSTNAVVYSSILILFFSLILTNMFFTH